MPVLVYSPGVEVLIDSKRLGTVDVTDDLVRGRMDLAIGRPHTFQCTVLNPSKKYDRLFQPNDRIVVRMKRLRWLQTFAGYLDSAPLFSVYSRSISIAATCTLKRLQFHNWDPSTIDSEALLHEDDDPSNIDIDGGMKRKAIRLLTEVGGWPAEHIHIGEVPGAWVDQISDLYEKLGDRIGAHQAAIGTGATIGGTDIKSGPTTMEGIDGNEFTGMLPASSGKISSFGGPNGGAPGSFELTGESGVSPDDGFYCAMRFPYNTDNGERPARVVPAGPAAKVAEARRWWTNRKLLITNPANGKQCVVRCADWGPAKWTGKTIDTAPYVHQVLGCQTNDEVTIGFAPLEAPLGLYRLSPARGFWGALSESASQSQRQQDVANAHGGGATLPTTSTPTGQSNLPRQLPRGTTSVPADAFAWGGYSNGTIPTEALATVKDPSGKSFFLHPLAGAAYERMRDAAMRDGIRLDLGNTYRSYDDQVATKQSRGVMAATPGTSNHGWGMAMDMEGGVNDFNSAAHAWMVNNGSRYGWILPGWAQQGGSTPEPWHWEFWGALGLTSLPTDLQPLVAGSSTAGGDPLVNVGQWSASVPASVAESSILSGIRALMNDEPILQTLSMVLGASMRQYCTAPNGDFIAWFPDYFGRFGTAGKLIIQDIELMDFTVDWTDQFLKTHWFASGASTGFNTLGAPGGEDADAIFQKYATTGIASVEFPEIMEALFNISPGNDPYGFLDAAAFLQRNGARPEFEAMQTITDPKAVFWYALHQFQKNWAEQFQATVPLTFMPELWPGMLLQIPKVGGEPVKFQAYIQAVTHDFSFTDGRGFSTNAVICAPSVIDGSSLYALARAGQ